MNKNPFITLLEIYKKSNKLPNANEVLEVLKDFYQIIFVCRKKVVPLHQI